MKILIVFAMWSFVGWLILFAGFSMRRDWRRRLEDERARATGAVVEHTYKGKPTGKERDAFPVIEFTAEGQLVRKTYDYALPKADFPVGRQLEVLYDPNDPTHFHLEMANSPEKGRKPIRFALIWIAASLVITLLMYGLVTGNIRNWGRDFDFDRLLHLLKRPKTTTVKADTEGVANGFKYTLRADGSVTLGSYVGDDDDVTLPLLADGHIVTEIGTGAFSTARGVKRVTVPGMFSAIPAGAFSGCLSLAEVELKDGVASIGSLAFAMCPSLRDVTIPASVERIADDAFPSDCAAVFHVAEGSAAQKYCAEKGFAWDVSAD